MTAIRTFVSQHPRLAMWFVLAVGMVAILLAAAWDKDLLPMQMIWLVVATVGLAGACAWIIGLE